MSGKLERALKTTWERGRAPARGRAAGPNAHCKDPVARGVCVGGTAPHMDTERDASRTPWAVSVCVGSHSGKLFKRIAHKLGYCTPAHGRIVATRCAICRTGGAHAGTQSSAPGSTTRLNSTAPAASLSMGLGSVQDKSYHITSHIAHYRVDLLRHPVRLVTAYQQSTGLSTYHTRPHVRQEWSNLLYGMALLKYYNSDVFQGLTTAVRPPTRFRDVPAPLPVGAPYHPETDRQYDEKIAKTGWAPCVEPPRDPRVYSSMLTSATSQAVSNILFALGVLRYLDEELVDELSLRLVAYGTAVTYSDLALALRAFVQVNYKPSGLMQLLENLEAKLRVGGVGCYWC